MATAFIMDFEGGTAEQYDAVIEEMGLENLLPEGATFHAAGATDTGWQVCDVWEDPEAFQRFAETKIGPISGSHGMSAPAMRSFPVHQERRGEAGPVGHMQIVRIAGMDAEGFARMDAAVLGEGREAPEGCVFHVNGPMGDDWVVLDYWTSREVHDAFIENNVRPAMEAAGVQGPPDIEATPVHNAMTEHTGDRAQA